MSESRPLSRTNIVPKGGGMVYSPQRDIAYLFMPAIKEALFALDKVNWTDDMKGVVKRLRVSEEDIGKAAQCLAVAHQYFVNVKDINSADDALKRADWYGNPPGVRNLIYARLGEVLLGGFFLAVRDVSEMAEESAASRDIADLVAAGRTIMEHSININREPPAIDQVLSIQAEMVTLRQALATSQDRNKAIQEECHQRIMMRTAAWDKEKVKLDKLNSMSFWARLVWAFCPGSCNAESADGEEEKGK